MKLRFSEPFYSVIKKIEQLQEYDRYQSAYIFGSVVRGEQNKDSDLDVMVVVNENNDCKEINHPIINGIKLDLTFRSIQQIRKINEEVVQKGERIPMHHVQGSPLTVPLPDTRHLDAHMPGGFRYNPGGPGSALPAYPPKKGAE